MTNYRIETYDRSWLDQNQYELTDDIFRKFNLLNEQDWSLSETIGIAFADGEIVGVIAGYDEICVVCQVCEAYRRQGVGTQLVQATKMFYPKQNGAPEFWEAIELYV